MMLGGPHCVLKDNSMIKITQKGSFDKTTRFLNFLYRRDFLRHLNEYGQEGVNALAAATPIDSGKTASSWGYEIETKLNRISITWTNSNIVDGVPIAIILNYGHATGNGGYVQGRDYIDPAVRPVFDHIADSVWREVTNA